MAGFEKETILYIKAAVKDRITILEDVFFTAPYKIAKPFFDHDNGILELVLMSASAGTMQGDRYNIKVALAPFARAALRGQSYNKIHRMKKGFASQRNLFILKEGSFFDYAPRPCIPFQDSSYQTITDCHLDSNSIFLYSEILACGKAKSGESFRFKQFRNRLCIYHGDELIYLENQYYDPACQNLQGIGFFEGYTHQATLGCFGDCITEKILDDLYGILHSTTGIDFGISQAYKHGIVVKILGDGGDFLEKVLSKLRERIYHLLLPKRQLDV